MARRLPPRLNSYRSCFWLNKLPIFGGFVNFGLTFDQSCSIHILRKKETGTPAAIPRSSPLFQLPPKFAASLNERESNGPGASTLRAITTVRSSEQTFATRSLPRK